MPTLPVDCQVTTQYISTAYQPPGGFNILSKLKFMKENYGHIELLHNVESQWCHI